MLTYKNGDYETRCIGGGGEGNYFVWQLIQYYKGDPIARFKIKERTIIKIYDLK